MYNIYSTIKFPCISLPDAGGDILFVSEDKRGPTVGAGLPSSSLKTIASQLREIRTTQSEQSQRYLELLETQSLELQKLKASLFSLERTVMKLGENADAGLLKDDSSDVDSLSSNPPLSESCTSLPRAFDSPPCGEPLLPSTSDKKLAPPFDDAFWSSSQDQALYQPVGIGMPSHNPSHLRRKFTPKSSNDVISLYRFYKNAKDIGKLAVALAKYTYFGPTIMAQSTVTGRGLDPIKLRLLQGNINAIFPQMDDHQLKEVWDKCKDSIVVACKSLRGCL